MMVVGSCFQQPVHIPDGVDWEFKRIYELRIHIYEYSFMNWELMKNLLHYLLSVFNVGLSMNLKKHEFI